MSAATPREPREMGRAYGPDERCVRAERSDDDLMADPWADRGTCRHCGRAIVRRRSTPDRHGDQRMHWQHIPTPQPVSAATPREPETPPRWTDRLAALLHETRRHSGAPCDLCITTAEGFRAQSEREAAALAAPPDALRKYGEHQHEWGRNAQDVPVVTRFCPDEDTGECWCGLSSALAAPGAALDVATMAQAIANVSDEDDFGYDDDHAARYLIAEYNRLVASLGATPDPQAEPET